jgi:hypothetical protein
MLREFLAAGLVDHRTSCRSRSSSVAGSNCGTGWRRWSSSTTSRRSDAQGVTISPSPDEGPVAASARRLRTRITEVERPDRTRVPSCDARIRRRGWFRGHLSHASSGESCAVDPNIRSSALAAAPGKWSWAAWM